MTSLGWWGVPLGGARRRHPREHAVSVREPRRVHHRAERPHQPRARGHPGHGRHDRLRVSYATGNPWLGVLAAAAPAPLLGLLHGLLCSLPRVNDIAVGIGLMLFGTGFAFFLGKPYVQPKAPTLPSIPLGGWSSSPQIQAALQVNPLFIIGLGAGARAGLGVPQHALGPGGAHGGRQLGRRARHGLRRERGAHAGHGRRRLAGRRSAARSCRSTTRAAGARGCRAARA